MTSAFGQATRTPNLLRALGASMLLVGIAAAPSPARWQHDPLPRMHLALWRCDRVVDFLTI
jgi:hypothetical protein